MFLCDRAIARHEGSCDEKTERVYEAVLAALEKPTATQVMEAVGALDKDGKNAITSMINGVRGGGIDALTHVARAASTDQHSESKLIKDPRFDEKPIMDDLLAAAKVD
jgi:hypothetical protein